MCARHELDADLERDRVFLYRAMCMITEKKMGYWLQLPFSLVRARDRGVLRKAMDEWDKALPDNRHRLASLWFDNSGLRADVEAYLETGELSQALEVEVLSMEKMCLAEEVIERPHAEMMRERGSQRAVARVWQAASSRLERNFGSV